MFTPCHSATVQCWLAAYCYCYYYEWAQCISIMHFVPPGINERCPLKFGTKSFDTEGQTTVALDRILPLTDESSSMWLPCAIIGASYSSISMTTSMISGLLDIPQISPFSTSRALDDKGMCRLFGRTIPNDDGTAIAILSRLQDWGVDHIAVIHVDDDLLGKISQPNTSGGSSHCVNAMGIVKAIGKLKATGFWYFMGMLQTNIVDEAMSEAYNKQIAGTGKHTWMFGDGVWGHIEYVSPLEKAYRGTSWLAATGGMEGMESYDVLGAEMRQLKNNDVDLADLNSLLPEGLENAIITSGKSFLEVPGLASPFLYDAVVSLGIAS
ncbi:hypothetical protein ACHAWF_007985, partial [Thalassiosira exigua]